ncbi:MAG: Soluble lytic murein transglycosylase precursor [Candidatus Bipolaricaulis sibiricus]|uniref:Soluble lytic murein transglycosylase n=1 Tax=Bipolaricaulis sibiricus TaxID=2501609 RepID=A0A410FVN7_BIPS1|nr:MAG: Soluble lytic murein transglycosylase precursor [Candidatus Bipolaricaulis sibiricus]
MKGLIGPLVLLGLLVGLTAFLLWTPAVAPHIGDYIRLAEARTHLSSSVRGLEALAGRDDGVGWQARSDLGRWYLAQGAAREAAALFRSALALYATSDLRADLAVALEASGRPGDALGEWQQLLPRRDAVQAVLRIEPDPVRAASILTRGGAATDALATLAAVGGTQAALERARALAATGKLTEALVEFERFLSSSPGDAGVHLEYGRALERAGALDRALLAYRAAGAAGAYAAGLLLESLGREDDALAAYRQSAEPEAKWRAARLLESSGRTPEALVLYGELARGAHRVGDDAALRLYLLHTRRGEPTKAAEARRYLSPALAWLAGVPVPAPALTSDPPRASPPVVSLATDLVQAFPGADGRRWAEIELAIAAARGTAADRLAIGEWYVAQGDWRNAFRMGSLVLGSLPCRRAYHLAYPLAWWDTVLRWAGTYGVDPYLVLAVIREESGFLPTAVSSSDARGLMQLLPSTARWIAEEKLRIPYREADLFAPDYNIRLGTWYLRHLLDQFGGDLAWAVAAYNGGPGNLRRWTADGVASPADLPAALRSPETREYLTKVLNAWLTYRWLYGGE